MDIGGISPISSSASTSAEVKLQKKQSDQAQDVAGQLLQGVEESALPSEDPNKGRNLNTLA